MNGRSLRARSSAAIVFLNVILFLAATAKAGDLREDYAALENQRRALEAQGLERRGQLDSLTAERRAAEAALRVCTSTSILGIVWEDRRKDIEGERNTLEAAREKLNQRRQELNGLARSLEVKRASIEAKHTSKWPGSEYETEFRAYMGEVSDYLDRLKDELFYGYDEYFAGVRGYLGFVVAMEKACREGDSRGLLIAEGLKHLKEITEAVAALTKVVAGV